MCPFRFCGAQESIPPAYVAWARICKPNKESRNRFPVRQPYLSYRTAMLHMLAESTPRNRFLGSINVYKYGPWLAGTTTLFYYSTILLFFYSIFIYIIYLHWFPIPRPSRIYLDSVTRLIRPLSTGRDRSRPIALNLKVAPLSLCWNKNNSFMQLR